MFNVSEVFSYLFVIFFLTSFPLVVPPKFETIMEDVDVHIGETCRLAVVVEGKPDPDILWYKVRCLRYEIFCFCFNFAGNYNC